MFNRLKRVAHNNTPRWVILTIDTLLAVLSFLTASLIIETVNENSFDTSSIIYPLLVVLLFRLKSFFITRSYTGIIKYTSTQDALRIFFAVTISSLGILIVEGLYFYSLNQHLLKPSIIIVDAFILIFLMSSFRLSFKLLYNRYGLANAVRAKKQIIVYGAGEAGVLVRRSLESDAKGNSKVVAFLDDNVKLQGKTVDGVKIYSPMIDFDNLYLENDNIELIIAINKISAIRKKLIIEKCIQQNIPVKVIPPVDAWIHGEFNPRAIKKVRIEDLLGREPIKLSINKIRSDLEDQVILITGAAGSIGSEIARQCLQFNPKKLILLDQGETPLYEIQQELKRDDVVDVVIADVCNHARMKKAFELFKPTYVFHAAAYKHVPLMEDNPYEAINTNVFGTQNVANLSAEFGVHKFVLVSTDKAVNPTNIMGASKRIAEIYVQSLNSKLELESDKHTMFVTTRFGNVLGSNGSVIPLFRRQIEEGGPVTVTHPEITRYFMTIPEACQLVLEAGTMGKGGEIYIFDMGESVKIIDLARKMIQLSGLEVDKDIRIVFTGLRPGEKLKEELLNQQENTIGTHNPKIMVAKVREYNFLEVNETIRQLYDNRDKLKNRSLVQTMKKIVPEYVSNNSIYEELDKDLIDS